jgi:hypothetical protein
VVSKRLEMVALNNSGQWDRGRLLAGICYLLFAIQSRHCSLGISLAIGYWLLYFTGTRWPFRADCWTASPTARERLPSSPVANG